LQYFSDFNVHNTLDLLKTIGVQDCMARNIPDHSVISGVTNITDSLCSPHPTQSTETLSAPGFDKFNMGSVPVSFLTDRYILTQVRFVIDKLEQGLRMQTDIDIAYDNWCKIVKHEMYDKLSFKTIYPDTMYSIRKRSPKPWWNDNLSNLFKKVHQAERDWLKCKDRAKKIALKHEYVLLRKHFGKEV